MIKIIIIFSTVENLRSGNMLSVLGVIMQLRKCCNHPNLFEPRPVISPYVAPMISPQFPRLIFSIQSQQSKDNRRVNLLIQNVVHTSMNAWTVFNEISTPASILNEPTHPQSGEESQHFPDGLKFVMDAHGGHFYRPTKCPPSESKESSATTTPMSNGVTHVCFFYLLKILSKFLKIFNLREVLHLFKI
jgi:SNF2 family DNA or RNA helicase